MNRLKTLFALGLMATGLSATPILYLVTQPGGTRTGMQLLTLDAATGITTLVGDTVNDVGGAPVEMFDIAVNALGELYGVDSGHNLYRINAFNARATLVAGFFGLGVATANGLAFGTDGLLYVSGAGSQDIRRFDPNAAASYETVALLPTGVNSGGDVVFHGNRLYVAADNDKIYEFDLSGFTPGNPVTAFRESSIQAPVGLGDIAFKGLASAGGLLYAAFDGTLPSQEDYLFTVDADGLGGGTLGLLAGFDITPNSAVGIGYAAGMTHFVGVPEPSTVLLSLLGLGLIGFGRAKRKQ